MRKLSDNRYAFSDGSTVTLSYAGQLPDGDVRGTRTAYEYEIRSADGDLIARDSVNGGVNMEFSLRQAWSAWASFMVAWADTYRGAMSRQSETTLDGDPLTPEHEWAYQNDDELQGLEYSADDE